MHTCACVDLVWVMCAAHQKALVSSDAHIRSKSATHSSKMKQRELLYASQPTPRLYSAPPRPRWCCVLTAVPAAQVPGQRRPWHAARERSPCSLDSLGAWPPRAVDAAASRQVDVAEADTACCFHVAIGTCARGIALHGSRESTALTGAAAGAHARRAVRPNRVASVPTQGVGTRRAGRIHCADRDVRGG